jgi:hypothetical protein
MWLIHTGAKPALASKRNDFGMRAIFSSATIGFVPPDCSAADQRVFDRNSTRDCLFSERFE